jgi:hypothetical protein
MNRLTWFQRVYWTRFSKPVAERELVRYIIANPIASLLEIGVGDGSRLKRVSQIVQMKAGVERIRYVGVDEFEASKDSRPHLSLKVAHQLASQLDFKVTLMPGDLKSAIPRVAHKIGASDLIIIDGGLDPANPEASLITGWLNRIAHEGSVVFSCGQHGQPLVRFNFSSAAQANRMAA